jgi:CysZ protein
VILLAPPLRALSQIADPVFLGVVWRSLAWSAITFIALAAGLAWGMVHLDAAMAGQGGGWLAWLAGLLGGAGAVFLALFLFLPLAAVIATLFLERVTRAVERHWYPGLSAPAPAPLLAQAWDGLALGLRILGLQVLALMLAILLPGVGLLLGWLIAAWAIGRGLFVAVAMLRMDRRSAAALYRRQRLAVVAQGGLIAACSAVPVLNLLVPVLGTAAMVHLLHLSGPAPGPGTRPAAGSERIGIGIVR